MVQARIRLVYGEWLQRHCHQIESRAPLRGARDAFDALGMGPWAERPARSCAPQVRAARAATATRSTNTPQELQIVQMVSQGLSNRVIAQRLYLSQRTVESHLYRLYPELGVRSRAQLISIFGGRLGTGH